MTIPQSPIANYLHVDSITRGLHAQRLGQRLIYYESVGSTNDIAKQLADAGEPEGTVVIADEQTAGRGRLGRTWVAPPRSSILMSLILRPNLASAQSTRVTMAVALGVRAAIAAETGLLTQIKWHNDIWINGKKCAGILAESGIVGEALEYIVVGLGINVNFAVASIAGIPSDATTMGEEIGRPLAREPLVQSTLRAIEKCYLRLCAGENLRDEYAAHLVPLNQSIRAQTPWGIEEGVAETVDDDGALFLHRADGSTVRLVAGEVTLHIAGRAR